MPTPKGRRFDLVEAVLPALFIAVAAGLFLYRNSRDQQPADPADDARTYSERYGPDRNSEGPEEWLIRDLFQDRRGGFFLDVGAGDYRQKSNTFYLESALGWRGIAVDPLTELEAGYRVHRPETIFRPFFVSDTSDQVARLYVLDGPRSNVSSGVQSFTEGFGSKAVSRVVPTITLNDLLTAERVESLDLVSMDIELWEPKALAGFDLGRFRPALVCIEAHPEVRQAILDYFAAHSYTVVGRYLRVDPANLYFTPLR